MRGDLRRSSSVHGGEKAGQENAHPTSYMYRI